MHCDELSFQELLDCLANNFNYDTENNAWNGEHNTETMQRVTTINLPHHYRRLPYASLL